MTLLAKNVHFTWKQRLSQLAFLLLVMVVVTAVSKVSSSTGKITLQEQPQGVMGTTCVLRVVVKTQDLQRAKEFLHNAERELRQCEALTSTWIETSEISRFNHAKAGEKVALSPFTMDFLRTAQQAWKDTDGAFDITCGPVWQLWRLAHEKNVLPDPAELERLRRESSWELIELGEDYAMKRHDSVTVVSGGLAKGMAIDRAMASLKRDGVLSAFIEVGGDVAVFNNERPIKMHASRDGNTELVTEIPKLENGGVCTSGHSARAFEIQGKRYSQIIDPKTSCPVETPWSVTIIASDATTADTWSTALEVLGTAGKAKLPVGAEVVEIR